MFFILLGCPSIIFELCYLWMLSSLFIINILLCLLLYFRYIESETKIFNYMSKNEKMFTKNEWVIFLLLAVAVTGLASPVNQLTNKQVVQKLYSFIYSSRHFSLQRRTTKPIWCSNTGFLHVLTWFQAIFFALPYPFEYKAPRCYRRSRQ